MVEGVVSAEDSPSPHPCCIHGDLLVEVTRDAIIMRTDVWVARTSDALLLALDPAITHLPTRANPLACS